MIYYQKFLNYPSATSRILLSNYSKSVIQNQRFVFYRFEDNSFIKTIKDYWLVESISSN